MVIRNFSPIEKMSEYEQELRQVYINWLAIEIESNKFGALSEISLSGVSLDNDEQHD